MVARRPLYPCASVSSARWSDIILSARRICGELMTARAPRRRSNQPALRPPLFPKQDRKKVVLRKGPLDTNEAYHVCCAADRVREPVVKSRQSWAELYAVEVDRALE